MVTIITEYSSWVSSGTKGRGREKGGTLAAECAHVRYAVSGKFDAVSEYRK